MKATFRISAKAREDIDTIWRYTFENWSLNQANYYYRLLFQEINTIVSDVNCGKDIGFIKPGYRQFKVKSHLIIYRIAEDGIVEVIRVLHQMMDISNQI
ncbi:type II toxin-antitoxin system RelE/ParE family toxin [Flavobacterium sp.]|jgi:toxin ParE1/3/4|uniref:type II toxin-antitoxin system RelE/ParE family toxin n=1 Tax=Flavobacterium sp. TaxID=239 RepID=UPI0022C1763D|nr:type II toxin-antitoxin system RelE/ParE family toxin [Flavobacterium sp.]MCZ8143709.1 type II toxin-antitoxin system RelE/ParE family toxin [Flavobacterium sp.]MCZ8366972.1 type II toxin-antitoxin system RelE/ParE family toxin [Flavobacterium sp.]